MTYYIDIQALYVAYFSEPAPPTTATTFVGEPRNVEPAYEIIDARDARPEPFRNDRPYLKRRKGRS